MADKTEGSKKEMQAIQKMMEDLLIAQETRLKFEISEQINATMATSEAQRQVQHNKAKFESNDTKIQGHEGNNMNNTYHWRGMSSSSTPRINTMRLKVPRFDGNNLQGWIFNIQEYFDFHKTLEEQRLQIAGFNLEGEALEWYQYMKRNNFLYGWHDFLEKIKIRFSPSQFVDYQAELSKLTQRGSVKEFQDEFERLMNKVSGISDPLLVSFFVGGLKTHLKREVHMAKLKSLMEAFSGALDCEARFEELVRKSQSTAASRWTNRSSMRGEVNNNTNNSSARVIGREYNTTTRSSAGILPTPNGVASKPPTLNNLPIRRLSVAEIHERRSKGLCYNYDEKFDRGHQCKERFLVLIGDYEDEDEGMEGALEAKGGDDVIITRDVSCLNSLDGQGSPRSLRLWGQLRGKHFIVLIDSGSTHNFIQPKVVEDLQLSTEPTKAFQVVVGNGDTMVCKYYCPKTKLALQGVKFKTDLYVLPIQGPDIMLGVQWLRELGKVTQDFEEMTMEFKWKKQKVTLQGNGIKVPQPIIFNELRAIWEAGEVSGLYEVYPIGVTEKSEQHNDEEQDIVEDSLPEPFKELLEEWADVFEYIPHSTLIQALDELLSKRTSLLRQLKDTLQQARHHMAQKPNKGRREVHYEGPGSPLFYSRPGRDFELGREFSAMSAPRHAMSCHVDSRPESRAPGRESSGPA
ncbi:hypothetical protein C2S52_015123 [Perilla frutescens var. hirtella]|nr:hypothetical protein C2S52_015123 [Perilla frutescens var. hirtella]